MEEECSGFGKSCDEILKMWLEKRRKYYKDHKEKILEQQRTNYRKKYPKKIKDEKKNE